VEKRCLERHTDEKGTRCLPEQNIKLLTGVGAVRILKVAEGGGGRRRGLEIGGTYKRFNGKGGC